jgi:predicted DNA binding CopG/RHH family protein
MSKLNKEERALLSDFNKGDFEPISSEKELERFRFAAKATFQRDQSVDIWLSPNELTAIKVKALQEGIPYQTLITSILHKYLNGRLVERQN